ncbi:MAG: FeoA family protein [Gordonia sp. (in: high G+C Gram-positive bacteria)]
MAVGSTATIREFSPDCPPEIRQRLSSLGFAYDTPVTKLRTAPMGSPSVYKVVGYQMCLRNREAEYIQCEPNVAGADRDE